MKLSTLYSRSTTGKITEFVIEIEGNKYRTITGFTDGKKVTSEFTTCKGKSYNNDNEQALKEATAIHRKKMEAGAFENIADIDRETFTEPMLASKWEDRKDKVKFPIYSQPKLDGIRMIAKADGLWSRTGKKIVAVPHIYEALKPLFQSNPNLILDGELYCDKYANDFNAICSLVKKTKPTKEDLDLSAKAIEYHVYDIASSTEIFSKRNAFLNELDLPKCCILVKTIVLNNAKSVDSQFEEYIEQGYEGQMLRLDLPYENKRSKSLLKHKNFVDEEFKIIDIVEGKGKHAGVASSMLFKTSKGVEFNSSINGNYDYLKEILLNKKNLIGQMATVKYFGITPDGSLRFPKVIAIRDYE